MALKVCRSCTTGGPNKDAGVTDMASLDPAIKVDNVGQLILCVAMSIWERLTSDILKKTSA